jgi:redox-sensitive bicupin YhaK (pirin superfamily)
MSTTTLHKAATRGHADHGWLDSYQSFSFADYYNPERIQFGVLRVLNDDSVDGGKGFGSHPHDNMEIISIPLEGSLVHEDNLGNRKEVGKGEIQVMSTGKGVFHSEYNGSKSQAAKFLQIWVFPNRLNVEPRYDQVRRDGEKEHNRLQPIISPFPGDAAAARDGSDSSGAGGGTWIYQDAWFYIGRFDQGHQVKYHLKRKGNGVYLFVINGSFRVGDGQQLDARDGLGIAGDEHISLSALSDGSEILVMEVPMINKII